MKAAPHSLPPHLLLVPPPGQTGYLVPSENKSTEDEISPSKAVTGEQEYQNHDVLGRHSFTGPNKSINGQNFYMMVAMENISGCYPIGNESTLVQVMGWH